MRKSLKARLKGFNICFNIIQQFVESNVRCVWTGRPTLLQACWKHVKSSLTFSLPRLPLKDFTLSNARRFYSSMGNPTGVKGLTRFKLSFDIDSTFPLFLKMLNGVEALWTLWSAIVENTHAQIRSQKSIWRSFSGRERLVSSCKFLAIKFREKCWFFCSRNVGTVWTASAQLRFCVQHLPNIRSTFVERKLVKCWNRLNGPLQH